MQRPPESAMITTQNTTTTINNNKNNNNNHNGNGNDNDNFARAVTVASAAAAAEVEVEVAATVFPVTNDWELNRKLRRHSRRKSRRRWAATSLIDKDQPRVQLTIHPDLANHLKRQGSHCHNRLNHDLENYHPSVSTVVPVLTNGTIVFIQETLV